MLDCLIQYGPHPMALRQTVRVSEAQKQFGGSEQRLDVIHGLPDAADMGTGRV
jgi:hypothetical protein